MELKIPKKISLKDGGGAEVSVDLSDLKLTSEQSKVLGKLLAEGNHSTITKGEWDIIKDVRAIVRAGGQSDLIVRFDWKWVRIDEPGRGFEDVRSGDYG